MPLQWMDRNKLSNHSKYTISIFLLTRECLRHWDRPRCRQDKLINIRWCHLISWYWPIEPLLDTGRSRGTDCSLRSVNLSTADKLWAGWGGNTCSDSRSHGNSGTAESVFWLKWWSGWAGIMSDRRLRIVRCQNTHCKLLFISCKRHKNYSKYTTLPTPDCSLTSELIRRCIKSTSKHCWS